MFRLKVTHGIVITALATLSFSCTKTSSVQAPTEAKKTQAADGNYENLDKGSEPKFNDQRQEVGGVEAGAKVNSPEIDILTKVDDSKKINGDRGEQSVAEVEKEAAPVNNGTATYKDFAGTVDTAQIQKWVEADKAKRGAEAANFRYAFIPTEFLATKEDANRARIGLSKALNSVAVEADEVHNPIDASDGHGIVFAIPITKYWNDQGQRKWNYAAAAQGRRPFSPAPRLALAPFQADTPVAADRLAYNVLHGAVYNEMINTPAGNGAGRQLKQQLGIGLRDVPTAKIGVKHAITYSPRFARRYKIPGRPGAFWESLDEFNGRSRELLWLNGQIPRDRGDGMISDFGTTASETWYHMKNGMLAYFIFGNANQERSKAEKSFVTDPLNNQSGDLLTGFCVFCHLSGVQSAPNDMWTALEEGRITSNVDAARSFWTNNDELAKQYAEDREIFVSSLKKIVLGMSDAESEWNTAVIEGADPKEPTYFLTKSIRGGKRDGSTDGLRRRGPDGKLGSN